MKNKKILIIIILFILFIINTILVMTNSYNIIDDNIHNLIMHLNSEIITKIMKGFTFLGSTLFVIILECIIFFYLLFNNKILKHKEKAFSSLTILIISTIMNNVVKLIVRRSRPEYMTVIENTFSYPSGHTMGATTIYGFLIYLINHQENLSKIDKIISSIILSIIICLVCISRIYLGTHFFSDIVGGILLSLIIVLTFSIINDKKKLF